MTQVKQRAFELLKNISDEKAVYVIKFIRAIENDSEADLEITMQSENRSDDFEKRQAAFDGFMQYAGRLPADFDYKKELVGGEALTAEAKKASKAPLPYHSKPTAFKNALAIMVCPTMSGCIR